MQDYTPNSLQLRCQFGVKNLMFIPFQFQRHQPLNPIIVSRIDIKLVHANIFIREDFIPETPFVCVFTLSRKINDYPPHRIYNIVLTNILLLHLITIEMTPTPYSQMKNVIRNIWFNSIYSLQWEVLLMDVPVASGRLKLQKYLMCILFCFRRQTTPSYH